MILFFIHHKLGIFVVNIQSFTSCYTFTLFFSSRVVCIFLYIHMVVDITKNYHFEGKYFFIIYTYYYVTFKMRGFIYYKIILHYTPTRVNMLHDGIDCIPHSGIFFRKYCQHRVLWYSPAISFQIKA